MKRIIIIGAGFAGLSALSALSSRRQEFAITLIDKKETFDFLPLLPDCIGRGIDPGFLAYKIKDIVGKQKISFLNAEVFSLDLENKIVATKSNRLEYDFLIIACGSGTNFYGNDNIQQCSDKLDSVADARRITDSVKNDFENLIISGGGYTGIEVATNLRIFLRKHKRNAKIIIAERAPSILGPLPQWMKDYTAENLKRLDIKVLTDTAIEKVENRRVYLGAKGVFENTYVIWAAGVKTPAFIQNLKVDKNPQGRIKTDEYLRINEGCFIAGDAGYFLFKNTYLRMAVQFAIFQGRCAAKNIIRSIKGKGLKKFEPLDLGYIIPMANNRSCGRVFGINLKGRFPTFLHFIMCIYRSYGLRNRWGIIKGLLRGGAK